MPTKHCVEIGRVAQIQFGESTGKIAAIVDIVDQNRALIDGPLSGVQRQAIQFKRLGLTKFKIRIPHGTSSKTVASAWEKDEINKKWGETPQAKRLKSLELMNREINRKVLVLKNKEKKSRPKPAKLEKKEKKPKKKPAKKVEKKK